VPCEHGVGRIVERGRFGVDDRHAAARGARQPGGRVDQAGSADHQHQLAVMRRLLGLGEDALGERLAEPHHGGPAHVAAAIAVRRAAGRHGIRVAARAGGVQPAVLRDVAVQRQHGFAAGPLVQAVHVLRDERQPPGVAFRETGQCAMPRVRLHLGDRLPAVRVPVPHHRGIRAEGFLGGQLLRIELRPQAGLRVTEGRHARLRAHAGAGEHDDMPRGTHPVADLLHVHERCRSASYKHTPLATETFRLSTAPRIGIATSSSQVLRVSWRRPAPSAPSTSASGPLKSAW